MHLKYEQYCISIKGFSQLWILTHRLDSKGGTPTDVTLKNAKLKSIAFFLLYGIPKMTFRI